VAGGNEHLLIRHRDDIAGRERRDGWTQTDHTAGRHDNQGDVRPNRCLQERVGTGRQLGAVWQPLTIASSARDRHGRTQPLDLLAKNGRGRARGQDDRPESLRVPGEHLERLPADRAGAAEDRDAARLFAHSTSQR
jgi:hypothetical protein